MQCPTKQFRCSTSFHRLIQAWQCFSSCATVVIGDYWKPLQVTSTVPLFLESQKQSTCWISNPVKLLICSSFVTLSYLKSDWLEMILAKECAYSSFLEMVSTSSWCLFIILLQLLNTDKQTIPRLAPTKWPVNILESTFFSNQSSLLSLTSFAFFPVFLVLAQQCHHFLHDMTKIGKMHFKA